MDSERGEGRRNEVIFEASRNRRRSCGGLWVNKRRDFVVGGDYAPGTLRAGRNLTFEAIDAFQI
jgi:hypothetical protein